MPRREPSPSMTRGRDDRGFALVLALTFVLVLSAGASLLIVRGRSTGALVESQIAASRFRMLADAGLVRGLRAAATPSDPLGEALASRKAPVVWSFEGSSIGLALESENAKADVNAAEPELLEAMLSVAIGDAIEGRRIAETIVDLRAEATVLPSADAALTPCERLRFGGSIQQATTVATRARGVDPRWMSAERFAALVDAASPELRRVLTDVDPATAERRAHRFLEQGALIYALVANVAGENDRTYQRAALFGLSVRQPRLYVIAYENRRKGARSLNCR